MPAVAVTTTSTAASHVLPALDKLSVLFFRMKQIDERESPTRRHQGERPFPANAGWESVLSSGVGLVIEWHVLRPQCEDSL